MKRILLLFLLLSLSLFAKINAIVSILPEKTFLEAIGGDKVNVTLMVLPGNSPHTYEPKPSQMKAVAKADLYFAIGVEFENIWLKKFTDLNHAMGVVDLSKNIKKEPIGGVQHRDENLDPHIWTVPNNVKIIAKHIVEALIEKDATNRAYYEANYQSFLTSIEKTDREIGEILSSLPKGTKFMVFHPSWGYFAKAYNLIQLPIEVEGKSPKPKELIALIKEAKAQKVTAIFTQPEFSDALAKVMANELQIQVLKVSPLSPQWSSNLIKIAKAIAGKE
jgi:zinc transport system substrate-binding protein